MANELPEPLTHWTDEEAAAAQAEALEAEQEWLDRQKEKKHARQPQSTEIFDINHAAAHLGVSAKWLYRNYRELPHILIPAGKRPRIKFRRADLDEWLTRHSFDWRKP